MALTKSQILALPVSLKARMIRCSDENNKFYVIAAGAAGTTAIPAGASPADLSAEATTRATNDTALSARITTLENSSGPTAPSYTSSPTITGGTGLTATLTCTPGTATGNPAPTYSGVWWKKPSGGSYASTGVTAGTYSVARSNGDTMQWRETASNGVGTPATSVSNELVAIADDNPYHVFIVAGQSNAAGYTGGVTVGANGYDEEMLVPDSGTAGIWNGSELVDFATLEQSQGNWWTPFAKTYFEQTGSRAAIIVAAFSGSGVVPGVDYETSGGSLDNWPDDGLDDMLIAQFEAFKTYAGSNDVPYEFHGILWCQGESEASAIGAGRMVASQILPALESLFDVFDSALSADLAAGKKLMQLVRVAPGVLGGGSPNEWSGAQLTRYGIGNDASNQVMGAYTDFAASNPDLARWAHTKPIYFARDAYNDLWDGVHWKQSAYNISGSEIANEVSDPGSVLVAPGAATGVSATSSTPWQNTVSWTPPASATSDPQSGYTETRIHRSTTSGFSPSDATLVGAMRETGITSWIDASSLLPSTTYYYKIETRNTYAGTYSAQASVTTGSLAAIPAAFVTASALADSTAITALWTDLVADGLDAGLIALVPMRSSMQAATPTTLFNVIRPTSGGNVYDFATFGSIAYDADGLVFDGVDDYAMSGANGLVPRTGSFSILLAAVVDSPNGVRLAQQDDGLGGEFNISAVPGPRFNESDQSGRTVASDTPWNGHPIMGLTYNVNGGYEIYQDDDTPTGYDNGLPCTYHVRVLANFYLSKYGPNPFYQPMNGRALLIWNRELTGAEYLAARNIIAAHFDL